VDSNGYTYQRKTDSKRPHIIRWRCSQRNAQLTCNATLLVRDGTYFPGGQQHTCVPKTGQDTSLEMIRDCKQRGIKRVFTSATELIEEATLQRIKPDQMAMHPTLPPPTRLAAQINYKRRKIRPSDPRDLEFELDNDYLPDDFVQGDVSVGPARHLMLASIAMLTLLGRAKTWYVDATFKLVKTPFTQLFSFHAFIKSGSALKQVPLCFVLMSRRTTADYSAVITHLLGLLPQPRVLQRVVVDVEAATW